jgi:large subunit ribosomal protein L19
MNIYRKRRNLTMDLVKAVEQDNLRNSFPEVDVGDFVKVFLKIKEGARERIQIFEGYVIARKGGGLSESITVRRVTYGVGVERILPVHSPKIEKIEIVRKGKVRRAKLYYLRDRVGKSAKITEKLVKRI